MIKLLSCLILVGATAHAVTYQPDLTPAPELSDATKAAVNFILNNSDPYAFIRGYVPPGYKAPVVDEFNPAPQTDPNLQANLAALGQAIEVHQGKREFPTTDYIEIGRYNPANQSFILKPITVVGINDPISTHGACLSHGNLIASDCFDALQVDPVHAKQFIQLLKDRHLQRRLQVVMNCRMIPKTTKYFPDPDGNYNNRYHADVAISACTLILPKDTPSELAAAIQLVQYTRTPEEDQFAAKYQGRGFSSGGTAPTVYVFQPEGRGIQAVGGSHVDARWFLVGGRILIDNGVYAVRECEVTDDILVLDRQLYRPVPVTVDNDGNVTLK